jgi:hypothetical protein
VAFRVGLDNMEQRKFLARLELGSDTSAVQPEDISMTLMCNMAAIIICIKFHTGLCMNF